MKKTILLTGATDGIGLATAQKLVTLGHHVLIHGRNEEKLSSTKAQLLSLEKGAVDSYRADLSDFSRVAAMAGAIANDFKQIDVIINNAGVYKTNTPITEYGQDLRFAVNTLAPYLLSTRLVSSLAEGGRVINLSSAAQAPVELDALQGKYPIQDPFNAYSQSKLAITMWSRHLAQVYGKDGPIIVAVNPGSLLASKMVKEGFGIPGKDINIGADILVKASVSDTFARSSGLYFDNDIGDFSAAHPDTQDKNKCEKLIEVMNAILNTY